ncbi:hypothetical protein E0I74_04940 [Rhizobium laguerreae]|uniref:hypothetical protein n=1 Tax=Rhizobium laguerreae TaxID=1076926 RepID=UPI00103B0E10|nr:hypothetical protein [Rhizobium laguerreae]TBX81896.1 hypothetical protein E0I74_04940 [Rhizobium laguerreae]
MLIKTKRLELEFHRADIYLNVTAFGWTYVTFLQFWRGGSRTTELYKAGLEPWLNEAARA